jgi:DNA-binding transcriptional LysR family regulator
MPMNLDDLKYFKKLCETHNVTRASEALGITQPAMSYSLKRLENELGEDLIIRKKNGVELTKLGEEFQKKSQLLISEWEGLQGLITSDNRDAKGEYSIGVHPSVALYTLDKILPKITKEFPNINFKLNHGLSRKMTEKVINWELDFGIVVNPIKFPDLVIKELCKDVVTIFHKKNCEKKLIFDPDLAQSQDILKKFKIQHDVMSGQILSKNLEVIAHLTAQGLGFGVLPARVAKLHPQLKALEGAPLFHDKICLVYRPEKQRNKISKSMLKIIGDVNF